MKVDTVLRIGKFHVIYEGEGWDRQWWTLQEPGKETTFVTRDFSRVSIRKGVNAALARYAKHCQISTVVVKDC